ADVFYPGDVVTFDSIGGGGTVLLTSAVFPRSTTVNISGSTGYTFAGTTFSGRIQTPIGRISGTGALIKQGSGSLTVLTDNDYSGGTQIAAGTLQLGTNPPPSSNLLAAGLNENTGGLLGTGPVAIS